MAIILSISLVLIQGVACKRERTCSSVVTFQLPEHDLLVNGLLIVTKELEDNSG